MKRITLLSILNLFYFYATSQYVFQIDDIDFSSLFIKDTVKTEKLDSIYIFTVETNLDSSKIGDTTEHYILKFDKNGDIMEEQIFDKKEKIYDIKYTYFDQKTAVCTAFFDLTECSTYPIKLTQKNYDEKHRLISIYKKIKSNECGNLILSEVDSLCYLNNNLMKELEILYDFENPNLFDSIISKYAYDTLGRKTGYESKPSATFFKSVPSRANFCLEDFKHIQYQYDANNELSKKTVTYSNSKLDVNDFVIKRYDLESDISIKTTRQNNTKFTAMSFWENHDFFEFNMGIMRKTNYVNGTNLPNKIYIYEDSFCKVFYFKYFHASSRR